MPTCPFCRIVAGEAPASIVWDGPDAVAFLDIRPLFHGHTLVVPRHHVETLPELDDEALTPLFRRARSVAAAMEAELGAAGSFVALNNRVSQSVPHLHVHVVPRNRKDGLRGFFWPRTTYASTDEADEVAGRLRRWLEANDGTASGEPAGAGDATAPAGDATAPAGTGTASGPASTGAAPGD